MKLLFYPLWLLALLLGTSDGSHNEWPSEVLELLEQPPMRNDNFTALFSGHYGGIAVMLNEIDGERIRVALTASNTDATNDHCYIFSLRKETPSEVQQMLAVYMEAFGAASTVSIFREVFKGLHICFPEGFEATFPIELLRQIPWISFVEHDSMVYGGCSATAPSSLINDLRNQPQKNPLASGYYDTPDMLRNKETSGNAFMQALERRLGAVVAQGASSPPVNVQQNAPWGLARISQPKRPLNDRCYEYASTGKGVNIYIVDSGVDAKHLGNNPLSLIIIEFEGRARVVFVAPGLLESKNRMPLSDCSGHGTEVASVAAGKLSGVAKHANILALQVLSCDGQGRNSDLIAALEWIAANYEHPGIINLSLGGPRSATLDMAVEAVIARGIPVVVAAGNDGANACEFSPAHLPLSMTVGASTQTDERAEFSNYGKCVKIFAPGHEIQVAKAIVRLDDPKTSLGFGISASTTVSIHLLNAITSNSQLPDVEDTEGVENAKGAKDVKKVEDDEEDNVTKEAPKGDFKAQKVDEDDENGNDYSFHEDGHFVVSSGTSLAAPAVTGVAALILERYPEISIPRLWSLVRAMSQKDSIRASTLRGSPNLLLQSPPGIDIDLLALDDENDGNDGLRAGKGGVLGTSGSLGLSPFTWSWILISALMILGLFGMFVILAGIRAIKAKKETIRRGRSYYRENSLSEPPTPFRGRPLAVY